MRRRLNICAHASTVKLSKCDNPSDLPPANELDYIEEPLLKITILSPTDYTGTIMDLCQTRRGEMIRMEYLSTERVELVYTIPLAEIVVDFFDALKSRTKGYASLDYEPLGYRACAVGEDRRVVEQRCCRCIQLGDAPRQGAGLRQENDGETTRTHSASAV